MRLEYSVFYRVTDAVFTFYESGFTTYSLFADP